MTRGLTRFRYLGVALLLLLGGVVCNAGFADDSCQNLTVLPGDADYGAYLARECVTCHSTDASSQGIPPITGWSEPDFAQVMREYQCKHRRHEVMEMVAGRLGNDEIAALATYFGGLKEDR